MKTLRELFDEQFNMFKVKTDLLLELYRKTAKSASFKTLHQQNEKKDQKSSDEFEMIKLIMRSHFQSEFIVQMVYIYYFTLFDAYISDSLEIIFSNNPKSLKTNKKSLSIEELLNFTDINDLHSAIVEDELHTFGYLSFKEQIKYLNEKFNFQFTENIDFIRQRIAIRNLLVHNKGLINGQFLKDFPKSEHEFGDKIILSPRFICTTFNNCNKFIYQYQELLLTKFKIT